MANYTYADYKQRVSIIQVALELGYRFDRSKGRSQPSFVQYDEMGRQIDRIYVKNPHNNAIQGYWRRSSTNGRNTGDLIGFVRENIAAFPEYVTARNEVHAINLVLARMAGVALDSHDLMKQFMDSLKEHPVKPFSLERYQREPGNIQAALTFVRQRGLTKETMELFKDNFEMIRDTEGKVDFRNLAFPFRKPGEESIVGYEVRGYGGFKSKAEGTDSTHACWMAYVGEKVPEMRHISELHFAESALDILAFVQLNRGQLDLDECLFVSFGGTFSKHQMRGVLQAYSDATPVLHFDNDLTGIMYDCETACILMDKDFKHVKQDDNLQLTVGDRSFSLPIEKFTYSRFRTHAGLHPNVRLWKAPGSFKDWNDVTISLMQPKQVGEKVLANEKVENLRRGFKL